MKILIDARLYGLENAGLGRYVMNLIDELSKLDKTNHYITLLRTKYFNILNLPENWTKIVADYRHYSLAEQVAIPLTIWRLKPDLVHFPHFNVPLLYRQKFIVTIHDLIMHKFSNKEVTLLPKWLYNLKRIGYNIIFSNAVNRASAIIVPSNSVKNELKNYYSKCSLSKIYPISEGSDLKRESVNEINSVNKYAVSVPYIVYYGNAFPHKNLEFLIKSLKVFNSTKIRLSLIVSTPTGHFAKKLTDFVSDLKVENFVKIYHDIKDAELINILKSSAAFVFPSLAEGFGLPGLEAMAAGTMLISSDIPVFREIYQDKAIYFRPDDTLSLIRALDKLLNMGDNERLIWINQGKNYTRGFTWDKMARETAEIYQKA